MMYTLRAVLVSCSVLMLVYGCSSAMLSCLSTPLTRWLNAGSWRSANLIYAVRMSPVALAATSVAMFTLPSFLKFEPVVSGENVGVLPVLFSAAWLLAAAIGIHRAWEAYSQTQAWVRRCTGHTAQCGADYNIAVVSAPEAAPVALAGLRRSTVLISTAARASLTASELRCAIAHELAHARASDNLKKLLIHACAFPGLGTLERAWLENIEFAADTAAVNSDADAVELASALVKVSRLHSGAPPAIVTCLAEASSPLLAARVERLLHRAEAAKPGRAALVGLTAGICATVLTVCVNYGALLQAAHEFTEWLVR